MATKQRPTIVLDKAYDTRKKWVEREFGEFVGKTVAQVRPLTRHESNDLGWEHDYEDGFVIVFTDGSALIPSRDPEGNGAGFLFVGNVEAVK